jgi:cellulose biosynthesis protein BcsQ
VPSRIQATVAYGAHPMNVVAIYNMKGGVGKTTAAVNLSYLAAASGQRVLVWDLDPQTASSFAFRIKPHVEGFGRKFLKNGETLRAAIKATDYDNLDLLPSDFAYRKFDRLLLDLGKPQRALTSLLETLGAEYDLVFLDCPAGFSVLTQGVFAAADFILVPTVPSVLSLRTVIRLIKWAERSEATAGLAAFLSMVDRRKALHRRACELSADYPDVFLSRHVPYASVVEQMAIRRMPLPVFAARDAATAMFAGISTELHARLAGLPRSPASHDRWTARLQAVESLMDRLESPDSQEPLPATVVPMSPPWRGRRGDSRSVGPYLVHRFDTEHQDLQQRGLALELHERHGRLIVVLERSADDEADGSRHVHVQVDRSWAVEILAGVMSPLTPLERRLGQPWPALFETARAIVGDRDLLRVESRLQESDADAGHRHDDSTRPTMVARQAV